jgi:hypothetical protein
VKLANYVNDKLKEALNQEKCINIEGIVDGLCFDLIQASRKFVKEGVLGYISRKNGIQSRYCFLFTDLFMTTKCKRSIVDYESNDSTGMNVVNFNDPEAAMAAVNSTPDHDEDGDRSTRKRKGRKNFFLRSAVSLQTIPLVWINDLPDGFVIQSAFQLVTPRKTYTFFVKDDAAKQEWIQAFEKQIDIFHSNPLLKDKPRADLYIPETSKYYMFSCSKPVEDFGYRTPPTPTSDSSPSDRSVLGIGIPRMRRLSEADRDRGDGNNTGTSPTGESRRKKHSSLTALLTKMKIKRRSMNKSIEGVDIYVVSDSEDEEEEPTKKMLPWMNDYHFRLADKQTHNKFIKLYDKITDEISPTLNLLQTEEEYERFVQNPLFGLKGIPTTRQYRMSISDEMLRSDMDQQTLSPISTQYKDPSASSGSPSTPRSNGDDFNDFLKNFKGTVSPEMVSGTEETQQPKEKKRRSIFFFGKK